MDEQGLQVEGRLTVREEEGAFLVVRADDPEDWLVRIERDGTFPAREWAENIVNVYNRRLSRRPTEPLRLRARARPVTIPGRRSMLRYTRREKRSLRGRWEALP
jgi:hypothetical protein